MNSFELNKIAMALLLTVLIMFGIFGLTDYIFDEEKLASNAYPIEVEAAADDAVVDDAVEEGPSFAELLAVASVDKGETVFKQCKACHTSDQGGKNLVGPNLWNVVGRTKASVDGFSYSDGMTNKGGAWTYDDLDAFLQKPSDFVEKTKMSFAGLKKASDRAAVIVLLRSLSDAPVDLPAVSAPAMEDPVAEEPAADQ